MKPVAFRLLGPKKIKVARSPSYFFLRKLRREKEIIELVWSHHQLDGLVRGLFLRDAIDKKLGIEACLAKPCANQVRNFDNKEVRL